MTDAVKKYLATIGKRGGEAGIGKAKRRSRQQYQEMAAKSAKARREKMMQRSRVLLVHDLQCDMGVYCNCKPKSRSAAVRKSRHRPAADKV